MTKIPASNSDIISMDYWYQIVINNDHKRYQDLSKKMLETLREEPPSSISAIMERVCVLKCTHCLYDKNHKSTKEFSIKFDLLGTVLNMVKQLPLENSSPHQARPCFLHEGRILRDWHIDIFEMIRNERPDVMIGLIDSGNYTPFIKEFRRRNLLLDWIDISVDGTREIHNMQRDKERQKSFDVAMHGLKHAREITKPKEAGGRVTSLFTLTKLNFSDLYNTASLLFSKNDELSVVDHDSGRQLDLIDEFHVAPMSPYLPENFPIEVSDEDMRVAWLQIKKLYLEHLAKNKSDIVLKLYRHEDLAKLAYAVGRKKLMKALTDTDYDDPYGVEIGLGHLKFYIDGVPVLYYPISIWPWETLLIDADAACRQATCQPYSISELRSGISKDGKDISEYTVRQLDKNSSYLETYKEEIDKWWLYFGKRFIDKEILVMNNIFNSG